MWCHYDMNTRPSEKKTLWMHLSLASDTLHPDHLMPKKHLQDPNTATVWKILQKLGVHVKKTLFRPKTLKQRFRLTMKRKAKNTPLWNNVSCLPTVKMKENLLVQEPQTTCEVISWWWKCYTVESLRHWSLIHLQIRQVHTQSMKLTWKLNF